MGYLSGAYKYLTNAVFGGSANIQGKISIFDPYYWRLKVTDSGISKKIVQNRTVTLLASDTGGITVSKPTTYSVDWSLNHDWIASATSGSLMVSTGNLLEVKPIGIGELEQGTNDYVLTVKKEANEGMAWEANPDTNNYLNSLGFNTDTGVITAGRERLTSLTVDIDNRYVALPAAGGAANRLAYWHNTTSISGSSELEYDGATFTVDAGIVHKTSTYTTLSTPVALNIGVGDYHVHIINIIDRVGIGGVAQSVILPDAIAGQEIIITTDCGLAAAAGPAPKHVILTPLGADNINGLLSTTTLNNNGNENYSIYKCTALYDGVTWAVAKMGAVS